MTVEKYSESLPPDLCRKIQRIMPQNGAAAFATAAFNYEDYEEVPGVAVMSVHLEAKEQDNKLWAIREIKRKSSAGDIMDDVHTLDTDLCFFDALHYSADWERHKEDPEHSDMVRVCDNGAENMMPHWRDVAAAEKQPLDRKTGLPAPAAAGDILVDGRFSCQDREAAAETKGNLAADDDLPVPGQNETPGRMLISLSEGPGRALAAGGDDLEVYGSSLGAIEKKYARCDKKYEKLQDSFDLVCESKGRFVTTALEGGEYKLAAASLYGGSSLTGLGFLLAPISIDLGAAIAAVGLLGITTGSIIGLTTCMAEKQNPAIFVTDSLAFPHRKFSRHMKAMRREAGRFAEDSPQRTAGLWLADQFEQAYHAVSVYNAFNKVSHGGGLLAKATLRRRTKAMETAYLRQGFTADGIKALKAEIKEKPAPSRRRFHSDFADEVSAQLRSKVEEYQSAMAAYQAREVKSLPGGGP